MSPGKIVGVICSLFGATWMFWAGVMFDHRPAGWPNIPVNVAFLHFTLHLPDGPVGQLAALQAAEKKAAVRTTRIVKAQAVETATAAKAEDVAQEHIRVVYRNIIQGVSTYVPPEADARCSVPVGFVRLHDAAARGVDLPGVSDAAREPNDAASGLELSTVAATVAGNYGIAAQNSEQLSALQDWIRAMQATSLAPP
jgi:hypothetical protein